ncbi:hypothetical protein FTO74_09725 [Granulicella sp. WH15]|uniref:hypothetical protein n=1 Tax=Granulicella sp. WH15 TaxID=2602070 RepID=UPI00136751AA|nr:hypothetical protein [Granulicella sp. WH15]QHN03614.1 hypothetical protein FTO74_09725 [Granulicella sp. WH15]
MFPAGTAGVALLALRLLVAGTFVMDGSDRWALVESFWDAAIYVIPASFLVIGLLTPYFSVLSVLIQISFLMTTCNHDLFHVITSILSGGILAMLGPGAYSVDACLFGRKLIRFPPRS